MSISYNEEIIRPPVHSMEIKLYSEKTTILVVSFADTNVSIVYTLYSIHYHIFSLPVLFMLFSNLLVSKTTLTV